MCLRKSPEVTPEAAAANRSNAQESTGPRSAEGKEKSKLNSLKHGGYTAAQNEQVVMAALGEDPKEYDALLADLLSSYGPGDSLWYQQVKDLAKLYWRQKRLERARGSIARRRLLDLRRDEERRREEIAAATFAVWEYDIPDIRPPASGDPVVRLRKLLSSLEIMRYQISQKNRFHPRYYHALEDLNLKRLATRTRRIVYLLRLFCDPVLVRDREEKDPQYRAMLLREFGPVEEAGEKQRAELLKLIEEEMEQVKREMEFAEVVHGEEVQVARDSALIPVGAEWEAIERQMAALERAIDRKVKILMQMRKEWARELKKSGGPTAADLAAMSAELAGILAKPAPAPEARKPTAVPAPQRE